MTGNVRLIKVMSRWSG